jgi:glycosyltransferase involved in cell wall biosynthesis
MTKTSVMTSGDSKLRILIFIGSLRSGGKERRLVELLTYFKTKGYFEFLVVVTKDEVHYRDFYKLDIPYHVIKKKWKKNDPTVFYQLYKIAKQFRPHLIHAWGRMQSFYTLPAVIVQGIPLVNSQITGAPVKSNKWSVWNLVDRLNFFFSKIILSNSKAGIEAFNPPGNKIKVVYNGINMNRFKNLPAVDNVKARYGITTPYAVLMTASFTSTKDYDLFFRIADKVTKLRDDISFIGVGGYDKDDSEYKRMLDLSSQSSKILFPGKIDEVEALVNACTIGVLFSTNGEGISNSIMEYMALAKPVIANDAGGMKELVRQNESGYLIANEKEDEIIALLIELIDDQEKCRSFGDAGKKIIEESFSLDQMGKGFEQVYKEVVATKEMYGHQLSTSS